MTRAEILAKIRKTVSSIITIAPKAASKTREWDVCMDIVEHATRMDMVAHQMRLTEAELQKYLDNVESRLKFLQEIYSGKRRKHPERSKRFFL